MMQAKRSRKSSWFGFAVILQDGLIGKRDALIAKKMWAEIEVKPIVVGNFTCNKVIEFMDYEIPMPLVNSDDYFIAVLKTALKEV